MKLVKNSFLFGVALVAAPFFLEGKPKTIKSDLIQTETYKEIIEKAKTLTIQKERAQALILLNLAIKKETKNIEAQIELIDAVEDIADLFLNERSQQEYELALSLSLNDSQLSKTHLNSALSLEPDHLGIQVELTRTLIKSGDCLGALDKAKGLIVQSPHYIGAQLVYSQAAVCAGKYDLFKSLKASFPYKKELPTWTALEAEFLFKTGQPQKSRELAAQTQGQALDYPEPIYWEWKALKELKIKSEGLAIKYLSECKKMTPRSRRKFISDPFLCLRTSEVETYLKSPHN